MIDLINLSKQAKRIGEQRRENGSKINKDPLIAAACETVEAQEAREAYIKKLMEIGPATEDSRLQTLIKKNEYAEELADVIICILTAAAEDEIDIENAILAKTTKNIKRALKKADKL